MNLQNVARLLQSKEQVIRETVLDKVQDKDLILYGSRGYNLQSPNHLRKKTTDYDLLASKPKKIAKELLETLKRRLDEEVTLRKASHKGTYKIRVGNEDVIDITQKKFTPKTKKVWGIKVRSLKSIKLNATKLSNNPKNEYRKEKDLDTLSKIKEIERIDNFF